MSISYSITAITGSPKVLDKQYADCRDILVDLWNNSKVSSITIPFTLGPPNKYILLFKGEGSTAISFTPDSNLANGQGFRNRELARAEITAVNGTVKYISEKYLKYTDDASDAWSNSNAISIGVGSIVGSGFILCDKYGSFSIKYATDSDGGARVLGGDNSSSPVAENDPATVLDI